MSQKYDAPAGPPPPAYGSEVNSPSPAPLQPAHVAPQSTGAPSQAGTEYYNATPQSQYAQPDYPPQQQQQQQQQGGYGQHPGPPGGYYQPGPQMGYAPQGQYGHQGAYYGPQGPQGAYYGGQSGYQQGYGPQGQYLDRRGRGSPGVMEGLLAACACCCCLDLLF